MHERSLLRTLLKQVQTIRRQHEAEQVTEVRIEVGPLSGVEPLLLLSAFDDLATDSTLADATLVIDEVSLLGQCRTCGAQSEVHDFDFRCPICGGGLRITRGDELQLVSVTLQSNQPAPESY